MPCLCVCVFVCVGFVHALCVGGRMCMYCSCIVCLCVVLFIFFFVHALYVCVYVCVIHTHTHTIHEQYIQTEPHIDTQCVGVFVWVCGCVYVCMFCSCTVCGGVCVCIVHALCVFGCVPFCRCC